MAEKILQTRIQLKYDSYANWTTNNPVLRIGEVAVATIPSGDTQEVNSVTAPQVLIKVGDGTSHYSALPFVSAKAADVYSWAKKSEADFKTWLQGLQLFDAYGAASTVANDLNSNMELLVNNTKDSLLGTDNSANEDLYNNKYTISNLKRRVDNVENNIGDMSQEGLGGTTIADGLLTLSQSLTEVETSNKTKLSSVTASDDSIKIDNTTATQPKIKVQLDDTAGNALELIQGKGLRVEIPSATEYSVVKDNSPGNFAAVYHLTKNGVNTGTAINIPKDMVVKSGEVVTNPAGQAAGTYIKLVLQNVADPLYINVGSLIEYVTSGSNTGDMVVVTVSNDHKVTATITDGTVTKAKLANAVQTELNKAHTHDNKSLLDTYTQTEANLADAVAKKHEHSNKNVLDGITSTKVSTWDTVTNKANDADLATIAKTGNVNDLIQTSGDVLIFNCGSSTVNI